MITKQKLQGLINEKNLFSFVLLINLMLICSLKFIPSMDGPAHLYNSNILLSLLQESQSPMKEFFTINSFYIPNWLSHSLLAIFKFFLPAWIAEKLLLILYVSGLSLSFRLLIKELNPENRYYSIIIFPFIYSFLFHLGFYNYSLSFIFLYYTVYYWMRHRFDFSPRSSFILLILFILTYYSALLTFFILGLCIGILILSETTLTSLNTQIKPSPALYVRRALVRLFIVSLPALIFFVIFYARSLSSSADTQPATGELIKWLNDVRPLIVYNYAKEEIFTEQILHILIAVIAVSLLYRFSVNNKIKFSLNDIFIVPVIIVLALLFIVPSGSYAGMMSDRLALMFYMVLIMAIFSQPMPPKAKYIFVPLILIIHFAILTDHYRVLGKLNKDAVMIYNTAKMIPEGSIVLPVDMTDNWIEPHFSNYLGAEKNLIILENYEASVGWFPVCWNTEKMPNILLDESSSVNGISWPANSQSKNSRQIDYIFLYGRKELSDLHELDHVLKQRFVLVYSSENEYIRLFRRRNSNDL